MKPLVFRLLGPPKNMKKYLMDVLFIFIKQYGLHMTTENLLRKLKPNFNFFTWGSMERYSHE